VAPGAWTSRAWWATAPGPRVGMDPRAGRLARAAARLVSRTAASGAGGRKAVHSNRGGPDRRHRPAPVDRRPCGKHGTPRCGREPRGSAGFHLAPPGHSELRGRPKNNLGVWRARRRAADGVERYLLVRTRRLALRGRRDRRRGRRCRHWCSAPQHRSGRFLDTDRQGEVRQRLRNFSVGAARQLHLPVAGSRAILGTARRTSDLLVGLHNWDVHFR